MTTTLTRPVSAPATGPAPVEWRVVSPTPGQVCVQVSRLGSIEHLVPALRAGEIRQCTVRVDCSAEELVTALGLSREPWHPADLASVARAVLAGFDRAGSDEVRDTTAATRAVLAGAPIIRPDRDRHDAVWPTRDHYRACRAAVASLIRSTPWEVR